MAYNTRQKEALLATLRQSGGQGFSANELVALVNKDGPKIGRTTVYRLLDDLLADGHVQRYQEPKTRGYKFRFVRDEDSFDVRCPVCRKIYHLRCEAFTGMRQTLREHLLRTHGFVMETAVPLFTGVCPSCRVKEAARLLDAQNNQTTKSS